MDIDKILTDIPDLTSMRLQRNALVSDLKTLKCSLISLTGHPRDTKDRQRLKFDKTQDFKAVSSKKDKPPNIEITTEQQPSPIHGRTDPIELAVVESSPSPPLPKPQLKMLSVLVQPEFQRSSQAPQVDDEERQAVLESQRSDKQTMNRNKRMFGMLMGTLQRFKTEETDRESTTRKRSKIEEKLEIAVEEEKASLTKEVARITKLKHSKEEFLNKLELKIDLVERFKNWDRSHRPLSQFMKTESKPKIYWAPKEHIPDTEKKQKETRDYWGICYAEKTAKFKKDMDQVEQSIKEHLKTQPEDLDNNNTTDG